MLYLISCMVVYVATILVCKKLGLLPVIGSNSWDKGKVAVADTVGIMCLMVLGSLGYPVVLPVAALIFWVLHPQTKKGD